jgi:hypothetical protein
MIFSTRDTKLYFNFDFEGASLRDVELHKQPKIIMDLKPTLEAPLL